MPRKYTRKTDRVIQKYHTKKEDNHVGRFKTVIPYYGGKLALVPALLQLLPPHQTYVEVFGGSGVFLLNKPRRDNELEIYNDVEKDLVNFFRVLRDNRLSLQRKLQLTPFSRAEYYDAKETLATLDEVDPLERARCWYVLARQSFAAAAGTGGWRVTKRVDPTKAWTNSVELLDYFSSRLSRVVIENLDWKELLRKYDDVNTLFYLDPPYTMGQRSGGKVYRNDENDMHIPLMFFLKHCKGKAILSGYQNALYDLELSDWDRYTLNVRSSAANSNTNADDRREEVIWVRPNSRVKQSLWDTPVHELLTIDPKDMEE